MSLVVTKPGQPTRRIAPAEIPEESFLQEYVVAHPEVLPLDDLREDLQLLVFAREFQTSHGPLDAVAIDDEGEIFIIETKLYKNQDKRRVLPQVLDYGAALWNDYPDPAELRAQFEVATRQTLGAPLTERMAELFGETPENCELLVTSAVGAVREGRVRFLVLMDRLDERLRTLIRFINENSRFDVFGVELRVFRFDGYEVTLPELHGADVRKTTGEGARRSWNEESFFVDASRRLDPTQVEALRHLLQFAQENADKISWGTGKTTGSFNPRFAKAGDKSLFTAWSDGTVHLNFRWLRDEHEELPEGAAAFGREVRRLDGIVLPDDFAGQYIRLDADLWVPNVRDLIQAMARTVVGQQP